MSPNIPVCSNSLRGLLPMKYPEVSRNGFLTLLNLSNVVIQILSPRSESDFELDAVPQAGGQGQQTVLEAVAEVQEPKGNKCKETI